MMNIVVEVKNDALLIRLAMIWVSTMRLSRASMQRIHSRR
jgi:hypothetical protein